ncbi:HIT domain-containing protein [Nocardia sp. NPDC056100]|uniref:HIT domain-containing protein n=1 Tax=Nocardia sp. NPDC056100 TaxID=3345712 RepID=UPI0035DA41C8
MTAPDSSAATVDYRTDPIGAARQGTNPNVLGRMRTGWAVIGNTQHLPGYCLLLHDGTADQLTELSRPDRVAFMHDLVLLGEAVEKACRAADPAFWRINYEVLGNFWPHLHGHIHPRYQWEPEHRRTAPVSLYGPERETPEHALDSRHDSLRKEIAAVLQEIVDEDTRQ